MSQLERDIEQRLFEDLAPRVDPEQLPVVFLLGSPRTGSTLVYQLMINAFGLAYITNLTNDAFGSCPAVGAWVGQRMGLQPPQSYDSLYGKTQSLAGPSEGSCVFRHWFGGDHPSQTRSSRFIDAGRAEHCLQSLAAIRAISGRPFLVKNAWNCFRIAELCQTLPRAAFVWIRRDIRLAALSDLESRRRHGDENTWNSATPASYLEIQQRPYWEQVVEQQFEYNRTIEQELARHRPSGFHELWYEDLCAEPAAALSRVHGWLSESDIGVEATEVPLPTLRSSAGPLGMDEDRERIDTYTRAHEARLGPMFRPTG